MVQSIVASLRRLTALPGDTDTTPSEIRNTYTTCWVIVLGVTPLLLLVSVVLPRFIGLILVIGPVLLLIAVAQILLIRSGRFFSAGPLLTVVGWATLTWAAWVTGGLYSPSLVAQFVLVVLAEMCNGWRWGVVSLSFGLATLAGFAWAQTAGVVPPSMIDLTPVMYASVVAIYLVALAVLESMLSTGMRRARGRVGLELAEKAAAEKRLRDVIDNAPFGAFVCELDAAGELRIGQTNVSATRVLGRDASGLVGQIVEEALPALEGTATLAAFKKTAVQGGTADADDLPLDVHGDQRVLDAHAFGISEGTLAIFFSDVTEKRHAEKEIHHAAFHDELTRLPNRKLMLDRLAMALAGAQRRDTRVALLFIDLDNFKPLNDEHGHAFGDQLLAAVALRLLNSARASDTVARFGGDEFTVLVPDVEHVSQVETIARKLLEAFERPIEIGGREVLVTLSIGIGVADEDDWSIAALMDRADKAMYEMKRAGRNGYRLSVPSPRLGGLEA
jgi:diguanylate cyclase (GGDEF)-like protein